MSQALQRSFSTPAVSTPSVAEAAWPAACAGSRTSYRPGTLRGARPGRQSRPYRHYGWLSRVPRGELTGPAVWPPIAQWPGVVGGVGAAHPAAPFGGPLLLIQATPGAVLFRPGNGVSEAFPAHRACGTNRLRLAFPHFTLGLTLSVWPEEQHDVLASARGGILPSPTRPWRHGHLPTYLRHETVSSNFRVFLQPSKRRVGRTRGRTSSAFTPSIHPTHYAALVFPHIRIPRSAARARKFRGQSRRRTGGGRYAPAVPTKPAGSAEPTLNCAIRYDRSAGRRENQAGPSARAGLLVADKRSPTGQS